MDTATLYAYNMEKKLITKFRSEFHEKMGYYPIVIGKENLPTNDTGIISLKDLKDVFIPFLPMRYGRQLHLHNKSRQRDLVELRNIYCFMAKRMKYSLKTIGHSIGNRDHTTVIHNLRSFADRMDTEETFRAKYQMIDRHLRETLNIETDESPIVDESDQISDKSESAILSGLLQVEDQTI